MTTDAPDFDAVRATWDDLLDRLAVRRGQVVYLGIDMARLPLPRLPFVLDREAIRARNAACCRFLLDLLLERVGPEGTVLAPAFSYSCGGGTPFILEDTPSEIGVFPEYLRTRPEAVRSIHPLFSVAGIGHRARAILDGTAGSAFGPSSPFGRLAAHDTLFLNLGVPFRCSMTYVHHLEQCHGCTHRFHKLLDIPVWAGGRRIAGPFMAYLRWRGVDCGPDLSRAEMRLIADGVMRTAEWQGGEFHAVSRADLERVGYALLAEDPYAFASRPVEVRLDDSLVADTLDPDMRVTFRLSPSP